jgi:inorganic triphosphatase YgiF
MGMELEWKYAATTEDLQAIRACFGGFGAIAMATTYYDTPGGDLSARRVTLRSRQENHRTVCTVKTPNANGSRGEWEVTGMTIEEAIPVLCKLSGWEELPALAATGVHPTCGARFTRLAVTLTLAECNLELALDQGELLGGGREVPLCEVEVEFKSGSQEAALRFAVTLAEAYGLQPEPRSKYSRAKALAKGE